MLDRWLHNETFQKQSALLDVRRVSADTAAENEELEQWLGHELMRNYFDPKKRAALVDTLLNLGIEGLADHVAQTNFPDDPKVVTGEFGEALVGAVFRKQRRYTVPILKLRYKHRRNAPAQAADLMAFRLSTTPPVIAVPEVKTRNVKELDAGKKAHQSLLGALATLNESIDFVASRLLDQGNPLGARVLALLSDDTKVIERHVFVVHEDSTWDERILQRLEEVVDATTEATVIRINNLKNRISRSYEVAARAVHPAGRGSIPTAEGTEEESTGA